MSASMRRGSVGGGGSSSASGEDYDVEMKSRDDMDMQSFPFYPYFKVDAQVKLMEELQKEKDAIMKRLATSTYEEARRIRWELVQAGILENQPDDNDDGRNPAMLLLQLNGSASLSESPSSSPIQASPASSSSTPPLSSYSDTSSSVSSLSSSSSSTSTSTSSSLCATHGAPPQPGTAPPVHMKTEPASAPLAQVKSEPSFLTFSPIITTITSPHSVTSTIIPSMTSSTSTADILANKKKRQRTSPEQLAILEQIFETEKMPSQQVRQQLSEQLGMSTRRIQIWFQNKRAKVKRHPGAAGGSGGAHGRPVDEGSTSDEGEGEGEGENEGEGEGSSENSITSSPVLGPSQPANIAIASLASITSFSPNSSPSVNRRSSIFGSSRSTSAVSSH